MSQLPVVPGVLPMHAHDERNVRPRKTLTPFPRGERGASFGPDFARTASGKSPLCNLISLPSRHFNRDRYQIRWHFRSLTYFLHLQRRNSSPFNDELSCNDAPRDARGGDALFILCACVFAFVLLPAFHQKLLLFVSSVSNSTVVKRASVLRGSICD